MWQSLRSGAAAAVRHPGLVGLLWAWSALLSLVAAAPVAVWWSGALSSRPRGDALRHEFSIEVLKEVSHYDVSPGWGLVWATAAAVLGLAALGNALVSGGLFEVLWTSGPPREARPLMHRFFRGAGRYFWVNLRALVLALATGFVLGAALLAAIAPLREAIGETQREWLAWIGALSPVGAIALTWVFSGSVLDFARARIVAHDTRAAARSWLAALRLVAAHAGPVLGPWAGYSLAGGILVVAGLLAGSALPSATWPGIVALIVVQQAVVALRAGLRVAQVATVIAYARSRGLTAAGVTRRRVPQSAAAVEAAHATAEALEPAAPEVDERRGVGGTD